MAVMAGYGQITAGYWPAVMIGAVLALIAVVDLVVTTAAKIKRARRRRSSVAAPMRNVGLFEEPSQQSDDPLVRCRDLIAEAVVVRQRISGLIDATTYQARMRDLAARCRR